MSSNDLSLAEDTYLEHLATINGINFTRREVDVIACLLNARGTSKIASFLSISPRTVVTHIRNIMLKLECNSRESIIDFIERSHRLAILRKYYSSLVINAVFEKSLTEISRLTRGINIACLVVFWDEQGHKNPFLPQLVNYLKLAGINSSSKIRENHQNLFQLSDESSDEGFIIYVIPNILLDQFSRDVATADPSSLSIQTLQHTKNILFLVPNSDDYGGASQELFGATVIDLLKKQNEYFTIFEILKNLLPNFNFENIISEFKKKYESLSHVVDVSDSKFFSETQKLIAKEKKNFPRISGFLKNRTWLSISAAFTIGFLGIGALTLQVIGGKKAVQKQDHILNESKKNITAPAIRSDLIIPVQAVFLERPKLIAQIDDGFKEKKGIQIVALVGIGGAGKTTLARQYAHQQEANVIWEINAETKNSLIGSFETLAYALSKTEEDRRTLRGLQEIKDATERKMKIVDFVKAHLMLISNWFLIYDNVEKFGDIQQFFPLDTETWGCGRVLLTTRDSNVQNNKYISHVLQVGELNENQKLTLFTKIMSQEASIPLSVKRASEARNFLKAIPSFPLDVSVASYYIRTANVSYEQYLKDLNMNDKTLTSVQEDILKESGDYTKTRYRIITLSLERLLENQDSFKELLLFISLLDSQNIPKDLLYRYKSPVIVDNYIYHLKKHSLIITHSSSFSTNSTLSIHRSTQAIILAYLVKSLNTQKINILIKSVANTLEDYIEELLDKEKLLETKQLISHLKMLLTHEDLLTDSIQGRIESELGYIYASLTLCMQATHLFEKALLKLRNNQDQNYDKIAQSLLFQGNAYLMLGNFKKAESVLQESIRMYKNMHPQNIDKLALNLVYTGNVYRWTGQYEKSKVLFQQSLNLYEKLPSQGCTGKAMALAYLGDIYRRLGNYKEAREFTEESLAFCKKYLPQGSVHQAWPLVYLGVIHKELGNYEKAINLINCSNTLYEEKFSKDSMYTSYGFVWLSKIYYDLGRYKEAKELAEKALLLYKKNNVNIDIYRIDGFACLGNSYKELGDYEKAKTYLEKALLFHETHYGKNHLESAYILDSLGKVFLLESDLATAQIFFYKALDIYQKHKHPSVYKCLENFSALYLKKSLELAQKQDIKEAQHFKMQAINALEKGLVIVKTHFPEDSPHKKRIELKLEKLKQ